MAKLEITRHYDSKGVYVRPAKPGAFIAAFHWFPLDRHIRVPGPGMKLKLKKQIGWCFKLNLFGGAGTQLPNSIFAGKTIFIGWRVKGGRPFKDMYKRALFRAGVTDNANKVPYSSAGS